MGPGVKGVTRGVVEQQEVAGAGPERQAVLCYAPAALKQRGREVEERVWTDLKFPKSLGALLKKIYPKLGLK